MIEEEVNQFNYCDKVDLHALDLAIQLKSVVAVAAEHGFRGIVVPLGRLESLVKEINRPNFGDKNIMPICAIDYPFGDSSIDVRTYSVASAKEKGAKEVEIVAPYNLLLEKDFRRIYEDVQSLVTASKKYDIGFRYVIDQNSPYIDDAIRTKLCRVISSTHVPAVSVSLGYFDTEISHSDNIVKMRAMKNKVGCQMKAFINPVDSNEFALYPKAGIDIVGLDWKKAANIVHGYEDMVQKKS
jgi:deoxyribose-phosphate aldolase